MISKMKAKKTDSSLVEFKYILIAIALGSLAGIVLPTYEKYFSTIGRMYISLIQLCTIPIILTTVIRSFEKLNRHKSLFPKIGKVFLLFLMASLIACLLGLAFGYIFKPGLLNPEDKAVIGKALSLLKENSTHSAIPDKVSFFDFISKIVPSNIFESMSKGNIASIILFSILFGTTLGSLPSSSVKLLNTFFNVIYDTFLKLVENIIRFLPVGVFFIFASQIAQAGIFIIKHLFILLIVIYAAFLTLIVFYMFLIKLHTGLSFLGALKGLKEALILAFTASSSFIAMPVALRCLQSNLRVNKLFSELTFPIGLSISPQGSVIFIAISIMTFSQMFDVPLGLEGYLITIFGSMIFATSIVGIPGAIVSLAPLYVSLGIPAEIAISILMIIDPFVDQINTLATVHANCGVTVIAEKISLGKSK